MSFRSRSRIRKKYNPFARAKKGEKYYYINWAGDAVSTEEELDIVDNYCYNNANYCKDKKLLEQRTLHETLNRQLWRFSLENGEGKNIWDGKSYHWYIYCINKDEFDIAYEFCAKGDKSYFPSKEVAKRAIEEIIKPFIKEHPDFVW